MEKYLGALKMQDWKMQDWILADQIAGLQNARMENAGPEDQYPLHVVFILGIGLYPDWNPPLIVN